jgi:hypothetical protein
MKQLNNSRIIRNKKVELPKSIVLSIIELQYLNQPSTAEYKIL